jgi:hypothetical protein
VKRSVLILWIVGCGGDDSGARPDVFVQQGPDYDLSCLNNTVSTVPMTIELTGKVYNLVPAGGYAGIKSAVTVRQVSDGTQVAMLTTDDEAMFTGELTTPGTPQRVRYGIAPVVSGPMPAYMTTNIPPWKSPLMNNLFIAGSGRVDAIASALEMAAAPTKGTLEVWMQDCTSPELVGATVQLDGADVTWAMYSGVGAWIPRATTLGHPQSQPFGSVAGLVNVEPGTHTVKVTAPGLTMESTVEVTAGAWSMILMVPGVPLN